MGDRNEHDPSALHSPARLVPNGLWPPGSGIGTLNKEGTMKRIILVVLLAIAAGTAWAEYRCTTNTIIIDGRVVTCTTCCTETGQCVTNCW